MRRIDGEGVCNIGHKGQGGIHRGGEKGRGWRRGKEGKGGF
jgi:hypothetical protein